ncbi:MAG: hypothetical protein AVDCRST_MAG61-3207 [uncultured Friedmanniella sp.]|uniref:DUF6458 domain-containing protein n=1 Tax=uncultured Friedmanniella sp. TaxID=335381 RepID=A0A6J4LN69_9ACTN|nr:DUF6458 family protein [uncultured Friedmanniella sp.]CAA9337358.1 MAG: hypothetical protein AVDCRST_MAG61-3207 [uncultured Friedmanniella sp.]
MGLGIGITLIVIGMILVTGVINVDTNLIDQTGLGWILLAAGILSILLGLVMNYQRTRSTHVEERRNTYDGR